MMKWILAATAVVGSTLAYFGQVTSGREGGASPAKSTATKGLRLPTTTRITRSADLATLCPSDATYRVTCQVTCFTMTFHTPVVTVRDGERVTIADTCQSQRVIATKTDGDGAVPISRDLSEGSVFDITVLAVDQDNVLVDVAATLQSVKPVARAGASDSLRVNTLSGRFMETLRLGEKSSASFGDKDVWTLEVTVQKGRCSTNGTAEQ